MNPHLDVALLTFQDETGTEVGEHAFIPSANPINSTGMEINALGYPGGSKGFTVTKGIVSGISNDFEHNRFTTDIAINQETREVQSWTRRAAWWGS